MTNAVKLMRERIDNWIIGWTDDLWPRHWNLTLRFFLTGMTTGAVFGLALLAAILLYSSS